MLAITTYATKNYLFVWPQMLRRVVAASNHLESGHFIFSTDKSKEAKAAAEIIEKELPANWHVHVIQHDIPNDSTENYKTDAQIRIAVLQGSAFAFARKLKVDYCWSVESDILVHPNSLKMSEWVLNMPDNYYDVAMVTYPNSLFLGGFGTPQNHIAQDFLPNERVLTEKLKKRLENSERFAKNYINKKQPLPKRWYNHKKKLDKLISECPSDGNLFNVIAKYGWRQRGWFESAYPGIGKGSIVPVKWVGLGCTLLSKRALSLATFEGYNGEGTQDLFLCWNRWNNNGLNICCIPHVLCDHVKPELDENRKKTGKIIHMKSYHETDGECIGHLRMKSQEWINI